MEKKQFRRNIKNLYFIIRYFGFKYLNTIHCINKQNKDVYEDFWECLQEEIYGLIEG